MGHPRWRSRGSHTRPRASRPGRSFFASPGSGPTATTSRPRPSSGGRWRWCASARWASRVPEVVVPDVRAAMGPAAARFHGDPTAELDVIGITGTNGKTTTAFLARHLLEAAGRSSGLLGTVKRVVGGVEEDVERTTPEAIDLQATFRRMVDAGDSACVMEVSSHALELGRASRDPLRLPRVHEPDAGPPRLPPVDGRLLRRQAAALRGAGHVDREPGRSLGAQAGGRARLRDLRDRARRGLPGARRALRPRRLDLRLRDARRLARAALAAAGRVQRAERARRGGGGALARGPARHRGRGAAPVRAGARPLRAGGRGPGLRSARGLRAHARLARERAARRARAHERQARGGVRRRRRPRPRQAAADGRRGAAAGRPRDRDLGQPPERGSRADHRRGDGRRGGGGGARGGPAQGDRAGRGGRRRRAT